MAGATSLKDYLKRYQSTNEEDDKKKKKKKKKSNAKPDALGVLVVDEDPVWQKPVKLEEEEDDDSPDEEKPVVDEDIEVKRMKRLEMLRARRPFGAIGEDGSGWTSFPPKDRNSAEMSSDMSPPRRQRARNDTPSPDREGRSVPTGGGDADLSPPRQRQRRHHTPSPEPNTKVQGFAEPDGDLSPPRQRRKHHYSPSPEPNTKPKYGGNSDLSPPRRRRVRNGTASPQPESKPSNGDTDLSPPRQRRHHYSPSPEPGADLSPPRKIKKDKGRPIEHDLATQLLHRRSNEVGISHVSVDPDLSPPRKNRKESSNLGDSKEQRKTGLLSGREIREEIDKTKKDSLLRFGQMDPSVSGRGAEPVYRDKKTGERISKDEFFKSKQKTEEKPKEKKLEWGKGLAQKREAEARLQELEITKDEPFARTRDDPKLDEMLKEKLRWGDPMAHLVKKKHSGPVLSDLADNEKMKESGFIIPQDIPSHSWIRRGLDVAPNRYGIKPGRHWDGVDRSTGFEKQLFKRKNDKQATEMEAYLWSVSDM